MKINDKPRRKSIRNSAVSKNGSGPHNGSAGDHGAGRINGTERRERAGRTAHDDGAPQYATALITGGSSGLGRGLALALAQEGTKVYVAARRREQLNSLVDEITRGGGRAEAIVLDVSDSDATHEVVSKLDARDPLDLVVANAGIGTPTPAKKTPWPQVRQVLSVNLMGAVATLMGALPGMVARNRGHLVGIASLAGLRGLPKFNAYSGSKAGLITFLESTRLDLHKTDIAVTTICPGWVKTEMTAKMRPSKLLIEADEAIRTIRRALRNREPVCLFPRGTAAVMTAVSLLPDSVYDFLVTRAKVPY